MRSISSYLCEICKKKFPLEKIQYSDDGKRVVCDSCRFKIIQKEEGKEKNVLSESSSKVKLICVDCRYKFLVRKGSKIKVRCPYCNSNKIIIDETTAEKLLQEVSRD